jgi:hypothetical protein
MTVSKSDFLSSNIISSNAGIPPPGSKSELLMGSPRNTEIWASSQ